MNSRQLAVLRATVLIVCLVLLMTPSFYYATFGGLVGAPVGRAERWATDEQAFSRPDWHIIGQRSAVAVLLGLALILSFRTKRHGNEEVRSAMAINWMAVNWKQGLLRIYALWVGAWAVVFVWDLWDMAHRPLDGPGILWIDAPGGIFWKLRNPPADWGLLFEDALIASAYALAPLAMFYLVRWIVRGFKSDGE